MRVSRNRSQFVRREEAPFKIRWIADNEIVAIYGDKILYSNLVDGDSLRPWCAGHVFPGLLNVGGSDINGIDFRSWRAALGKHHGDQAGTGPNIEDMVVSFSQFDPGTKQHAIRAHLVGTAVLGNTEVFKMKWF